MKFLQYDSENSDSSAKTFSRSFQVPDVKKLFLASKNFSSDFRKIFSGQSSDFERIEINDSQEYVRQLKVNLQQIDSIQNEFNRYKAKINEIL